MKQKILDASPSMGSSFFLDAVVNIDLAIRNAQTRMWKALNTGNRVQSFSRKQKKY